MGGTREDARDVVNGDPPAVPRPDEKPASLDLYLSDTPRKTREQILKAVGSAA